MESALASYLKHTVFFFLCVFELYTITHCHDVGSYSTPNNLAGLELLALPLSGYSDVAWRMFCVYNSTSNLLLPFSLSPVVIRDIFLLRSCLIKPFCCAGVGDTTERVKWL